MSDIVIEFFGPPASGKSTLARKTAARLEQEGIDVANPFYTLAHESSAPERYLGKSIRAGRSLLESPTYSLRVVRTVRNTDQSTATDAVKNAFNWLFLTGVVRSPDAEVGILDQGLCQAAASIRLSGAADVPLTDLIEPVVSHPSVYLVVVVDADRDVLRTRLTARRDNPSRVGTRYSLHDYADAADELMSEVHRALDPGPVRFLRVRNERARDLERNVEKIVEALERVSVHEPAR